VALITALNTQITQITQMEAQVVAHFGRHRTLSATAASQGLAMCSPPGCSPSSATTPPATQGARSRKNYAGTSPITRASGKKKTVLARYARNDRLANALHQQAFSALTGSPGARGYYDALRARGIGHHAALRQLANRLVGILHGCLKTGTTYNEQTAWSHLEQDQPTAA
jgi:hypothetical protein